MTSRKLISSTAFVCALIFLALAFIPGVISSPSPAQRGPKEETIPVAQGRPAASPAQAALARIKAFTPAPLTTSVSAKTGQYDFVGAPAGKVMVPDETSANPKPRALAFLGAHGDLAGLTSDEREALSRGGASAAGSDLQILRSETDDLGSSHVRLNQFYQGLRVFGAQLVVHMNNAGITALNGDFVPNISLSTTPRLSKENAGATALAMARKGSGDPAAEKIEKTELAVYPAGLLEGRTVESRLAYAVNVIGAKGADQVWIDAQTGEVLIHIPLHETALNRTIYSPNYDPANPDLFVQRREGDPAHPTPFVNNLYDFAGQTYNFYRSAFNRDSFDALGKHMISVYLINQQCPNAYWNGTSTNYCPAFDADDVVSHEWSHAYTEYTHGLIYAYQSGALNEAYSDIFGESVDLINGADGMGGSNNAQVYPKGQRWLVGEDLGQEVQELLLRDMYDPDRLGDPGKVSSPNYACGNDDGGGVHTNSGVPNHGFAFVVDGTQFTPAVPEIGQAAGTYNGQTVIGIGLTKASAIYYRAESVYQTPTTTFAQHATALHNSCTDLIGQPLKDPTTASATGANSSAVISATDCQQVDKAMLAVQMSTVPPCNFGPVLRDDPAPLCNGAQSIFSEDWETGDDGWTRTSMGFGTGSTDWEDDRNPPVTGPHAVRDFKLTGNLPEGRTGTAAFAVDPKVGAPGGGTCQAGTGDYSGSFTLDSPSITIPAGVNAPLLVFDHWIASEAGVDGGQVEISVNNGSYQLLSKNAYLFNAPNNIYNAAAPLGNNTGPNPGEIAWSGFNVGIATIANWGTTVLNLGSVAHAGDSIKIRFTWSQDGCNGIAGWYLDNIRVVTCPLLLPPTLNTAADYQNPDPDGNFTLNWTRPLGATGPDLVQTSQTSCTPVFSDNAEGGTGNWTIAKESTFAPMWTSAPAGAKPQHASATFWAMPPSEAGFGFTTLTYKNPITIPGVGKTTLSFSQFYFNETGDSGAVEVSTDNGTNWAQVYKNTREMGSLPDAGANAFANEDLVRQEVDLTGYGGQSIRVRFKYTMGDTDYFLFVTYGWYLDDIVIANDNWTDVAATAGTSLPQSKGTGSYCYRVRTNYLLGGDLVPSLFSNVVNVNVAPGVIPVFSRKLHAGTHDIPLPLTGFAGVEGRRGTGASSNNHQIVFQFAQPVTFGSATVTPAGGKSAEIDSTTVSGNEVLVNLRNVSDVQTITVQLLNVNDAGTTRNLSVPIGILLGDTNGDHSVNSGDAQETRNRSGQTTDDGNFRSDANLDGVVNSGDAIIVRNRSGSGIP